MNDAINFGKFIELHFLIDLDNYMFENKKKFQIYTPFLDDNGIDYVIRTDSGEYIEFQIKGRKEKRIFTITQDFKPRKNYLFIFYCVNEKDRYILSSKEVAKMLTDNNHIHMTKDMEKYKKKNFDCIFK